MRLASACLCRCWQTASLSSSLKIGRTSCPNLDPMCAHKGGRRGLPFQKVPWSRRNHNAISKKRVYFAIKTGGNWAFGGRCTESMREIKSLWKWTGPWNVGKTCRMITQHGIIPFPTSSITWKRKDLFLTMVVDVGRSACGRIYLNMPLKFTPQYRIFTIFLAICMMRPLGSSVASSARLSSVLSRNYAELPRAARESVGYHAKERNRGWEDIESVSREYAEEIVLEPMMDEDGGRACIIWLHGQASCGEELARTLGMSENSNKVSHTRHHRMSLFI